MTRSLSLVVFALISTLCWNTGMAKESPKVSHESFGKLPDGREATLYTLTNSHGLKVKATDYGATIVSVEVPDRDGKAANVVLTFDSAKGFAGGTAYFGATVGRYANRIADGKFSLDGKEYKLAQNNGDNHLHGGLKGFDKQLWKAKPFTKDDAAGVTFSYTSKDGEEGYPGNLDVEVTFTWDNDNALTIDYKAETDAKTVLNLTNHAYWNLRGRKGDILNHKVMINADRMVAVDEELIPTGELKSVEGTPIDFRKEKPIGQDIKDWKPMGDNGPGGYDNCLVLNNDSGELALAARVTDPESGRVMEVLTTEPGIQFYTGNFLDGDPANGGHEQHGAFCLETNHFPDSPNHDNFPSTVLKPGDTYTQKTVYRFRTEK